MKDTSDQKETVVFAGKIGEVVHTVQPDGRVFERFRRSPGVRLIIVSPEGKLLATREFRQETGSYDLRLPGGKVCDTLEEYKALLASSEDLIEAAKRAAIKEAREETGLEIRNPEFVVKAVAGATVEWDLYYFLGREYRKLEGGQQLEHGEDIETFWMGPTEVGEAITAGQMHEWRTAGVLLGKILPVLS